MKGCVRIEGKAQTSTIYPGPFFLLSTHASILSVSSRPRRQSSVSVTVGIRTRAWLAEEGVVRLMTGDVTGAGRSRRGGERAQDDTDVSPRQPSGVTTPAEGRHVLPRLQTPPQPSSCCLPDGHPGEALREGSRRNPINVMPDNPHLRPVVVTQHRELILNSCLSLRSRAVQPRGAVVLHHA